MKKRLNSLLSEVGESVDYLRSAIRNLGRYLAELEKLIEGYRTFAISPTFPIPADRVTRRKLLKRTLKVIGPLPLPSPSNPGWDSEEAVSGNDTQIEALIPP